MSGLLSAGGVLGFRGGGGVGLVVDIQGGDNARDRVSRF